MIHLPHIFMVVQPFEMDVSENASVYSAYLAQNNHSHASGKSVFFLTSGMGTSLFFRENQVWTSAFL